MIKKIYLLIFNNKLYSYSFIGLIISCVIFPNSLIITSAISLVVCFLCAITKVKIDHQLFLVLKFWAASSIVTFVYIIVGIYNGAPNDAAKQIFIIYIISPFLWIFVLKYLLTVIFLELIVKRLIALGVLSSLSVILYYYLFFNYGVESIQFFTGDSIDDPRAFYTGMPHIQEGGEPTLDRKDGYVGIGMHVFGPMIFLVGGFISSFNFFNKNKIKYLILLLFLLISLVSGRRMLILSVLISFIINAIVLKGNLGRLRSLAFFKNLVWLIFICILIYTTLDFYDLKFESLMEPLIERLNPNSGHWRFMLLGQLFDGIIDNWGLGSGHGMHVAWYFDELQPWSYELLWVSSIFKVGFIGAAIYAAPFILMSYLGLRALMNRALNENEVFILGGGLCAFIASNTNQYPESFVFQWMYVLPVLYFTQEKFLNFPKHSTDRKNKMKTFL